MSLRYLHYDVFTDRPLEGNQLAVFPEPAGLTDDLMQRIAREMNFSESTFIFPPERPDTDVRMRIFTPGEELPMAGHPTIGSTFALAHEGVIARGRTQFVFGLGVGPTPVSLEWRGDGLDFAWMTQGLPVFGARIAGREAFAAALGVDVPDLLAGAPIEVVSCGVPFLFAPLASRGAVDRAAINRPAYAACCRASAVDELPLFLFTVDGGRAEAESVYSRMLAPGFGIAEDPATGGASGPLGCYLAQHGLLPAGRLGHFISWQGVAMQRPSRIHISIGREGGRIASVRVGGRSVLVGEGTLRIPPS
ncbi:MAG: PhzF family phenazine biosynthesis protein [Gemmatimonadaceae bacterium]|nr:PhzF family phenazine biosynthesis protein [Gemmatimonadaceae bacterium]NUR53281.1 PhzF family phenazine biosynthesis protein [Acidobacteriota bacterium]